MDESEWRFAIVTTASGPIRKARNTDEKELYQAAVSKWGSENGICGESGIAGHARSKPATGELVIPTTATFSDAHRLAAAAFFEFAKYKVTLDDQ